MHLTLINIIRILKGHYSPLLNLKGAIIRISNDEIPRSYDSFVHVRESKMTESSNGAICLCIYHRSLNVCRGPSMCAAIFSSGNFLSSVSWILAAASSCRSTITSMMVGSRHDILRYYFAPSCRSWDITDIFPTVPSVSLTYRVSIHIHNSFNNLYNLPEMRRDFLDEQYLIAWFWKKVSDSWTSTCHRVAGSLLYIS